MNTTFHFTSAQELTPAILDIIRQAYQEKPINIYIEEDESAMSDWEMQELRRREQIFLEPDDDFRSAITGDELIAGICEDLDTFFASKK
ncbi:MAG: hypothetical protein FWE63_01140 [Bacteroidales bacterium]|nr:hypothetical protein [Bacteroidales bacterium]